MVETAVTGPTGSQRHRGTIQPEGRGALWIPTAHPTNCSGVGMVTAAYKPRPVLSRAAMLGCYWMLQAEQHGSSLSG